MRPRPRRLSGFPTLSPVILMAALLGAAAVASAQSPPLELRKGDRIVLLGNTMAERMQLFNHFEAMLIAGSPDLDLVVRNLGWSGDTITLQPRPLNFGDAAAHLKAQQPDVIIAFFGLNESFAGETGLPAFERDLDAYLGKLIDGQYSSKGPTRIALVSPMAQERLARLEGYVDVKARNADIARYTDVMRKVAARRKVTFVDLYTPTATLMANGGDPLTINGIHVNDHGDAVIAPLLIDGLGLGPSTTIPSSGQAFERLRELIRDKNQQFFYRWRPVNAEYVVGRRVEPFGAVNFPPEQKQLDGIVTDSDQQIWAEAHAIPRGGLPGQPGGAR